MGKLLPEKVESVARGLSSACQAVGCALIGGETAEMPGLYSGDDYDLAGFIVGVVEKDAVVNGNLIQAGDAILGLPSSGPHTNGYSLIRKVLGTRSATLNVFYQEFGQTLGEELLEPHRCYYSQLKPVMPLIKGIAHITGGGLPGNIPRVLPQGLAAQVRREAWTPPAIFSLIQRRGNVEWQEMYRVFNMGVGIVLFSSPDAAAKLTRAIPDALVMGEVIRQRDEKRVMIE
jgi:phosphoribosylformylglycinamidine cyclo-ligase